MRRVDVAVVGGGPAGAIVATLLARAGREVVILERSPQPAWRACGVFASPASSALLGEAGLDADTLAAVGRPVPAMRVETRTGRSFRLTYGDDGSLRAPAIGYDRPALDVALLGLAAAAGVEVRPAVTVVGVAFDAGRARFARLELRETGADPAGAGVPEGPASETPATSSGTSQLGARVVVGADGIRSVVARSVGVARPARLGRRIGLTFHQADPGPPGPRDARMIVGAGAYCGIAPVPGGRVNVGIVLASREWLAALARDGAARVARRIVEAIPPTPDDPALWRHGDRCDQISGAAPLGHRVARRAGDGWLLVGDAAGFLDPFTGEGLHRALVSARLGALAVDRHLAGGSGALRAYDRAMGRRFAAKDLVTEIVQAFLARPALFDYAARRLARRPGVRETMGLVIGDLLPAGRVLDPRFLAALLAP